MGLTKHKGKSEDQRLLERRQMVWDLRVAGATYRQIAEKLKVSHVTVHKDCMITMAERQAQMAELIDGYVAMENERLDALLLGLWPAARKGDPESVRAAVRVMERRAKLLGLDQPTKTEHTGAPIVVNQTMTLTGLTDEELERKMREAIAVIEGHVVDVTPAALPEPTVDDKAEAYRRELAKRSGKG